MTRPIREKQDLLEELDKKYGKKEIDYRTQETETPFSVIDVLEEYYPDNDLEKHGEGLQGSHPKHGSDTGFNFKVVADENKWCCFHDTHECGGGPFELLAVFEDVVECGSWDWGDETPLKGEKWLDVVEKAERKGLISEEKAIELAKSKGTDEVSETVHVGGEEIQIAFRDIYRDSKATRGTFYAQVDRNEYVEEDLKIGRRNISTFASNVADKENLGKGSGTALGERMGDLKSEAINLAKEREKEESEKREEESTFEEKFSNALDEAYNDAESVEIHPVIDYNEGMGVSLGVPLSLEGEEKETIITEESLFARNNSVQQLKGESPNHSISIQDVNAPSVSDFTYSKILSLVVEVRDKGKIEKEGKSGELFQQVYRKVRYYWWHRDERWQLALTCWIIATYFHRLFSAFPPWVAQGERETGKTTSLKVIRLMAWNPTKVNTNLRVAPLYRKIEGTRPTYIVDITKLTKEQRIELQDAVESGTERGGSVPRCVGENNDVRNFPTYSPKAMASRRDLPFVAKSIRVFSTEPDDKDKKKEFVKRWHEMQNDPDREEIVGGLLRLLLTEWKKVLEAYKSIEQSDSLMGRRFTYWRPLLAVCKAFAPEKLEELRELAVEDAEKMEATDFTYDVETAVLGYLMGRSKGEEQETLSVLLTGSNSITEGVENMMGQDVPWQTVRSAAHNLGIIKREYETSSGKKYSVDMKKVEKRAEARNIEIEGLEERDSEGGVCDRCGELATDHVGAPLCRKHARIERAIIEAKKIFDEEGGLLTKTALVGEVASSGFPEDTAKKAVSELDNRGKLEFEQDELGENEEFDTKKANSE